MAGSRVEPQTSDPSSAAPRDLARVALWVVAGTAAATVLVTGNTTVYGVTQLPTFYDNSLPRLIVAVLGTLAALLLLALHAARGRAWRIHPAMVLLAVTALLAFVSAYAAADAGLAIMGIVDRLEGVFTWLLYPMVALAGCNAVRRAKDLRTLAVTITVAAVICALYGLLQWAGVEWANLTIENPGFDPRRAFATFGNPNFLAGLMVLVLPIGVGLAFSEKSEVAAAAWWTAAVAVGVALFATFTRGAWIGGAVAVGLLVVQLRRRVSLRHVDLFALGMCAFAAVGALVASLAADGEVNIIARLTANTSSVGSLSERFLTWEAAVASIAQKPLFGWGPDGFLTAFRLHRPEQIAEVFGGAYLNSNAHDWPLQAAATLGVPAALAFCAAIVFALVGAWRSGDGEGDVLAGAVAAGCVGFSVHMLFNVAVLGATVPFFALLGGALSPVARRVALPRMASWGIAAGLAVMAIAALAFFVPVVNADHDYLASRLAYRGIAGGDAVALARAAATGDPTRVRYSRGAAETLAARYYESVPVAGAGARELFDAADAAFVAHNLKYPADYPGVAWHAALLAAGAESLGDETLARRAREVAGRAMELDAQGTQVEALADGETGRAARASALSVPGVP